MDFLAEYGMFALKAVTTLTVSVILIVLLLGQIRSLFDVAFQRGPRDPGLKVERLNDEYRDLKLTMERATVSPASWKVTAKKERKRRKLEAKSKTVPAPERRRIFVMDFRGDIRASAVGSLRREISAILTLANERDEVVVRLENPGGTVHEHGLAASQLLRIREAGVPLTIVVDKVAASGGYLMACTADKIIAAPFAIIGSIGVVAQLPNFHRALKERGIDFEQFTAGKYKRTVTMFGENTDEGRAKLLEEIEGIHGLFKSLVAKQRPNMDLDKVATGEHWHGTQALELGLIDELGSSDDYLIGAIEHADLFHVRYRARQRLQERALQTLRALFSFQVQ